MNDHADLDLASRVLWQRATGPLLRSLLGDPTLRLIRVLDTRTQGVRRHADAAALLEGPGGPFIAHVEFDVGSRPAELPARMYVYGAMLYAAHQHRYPVRSTLVLLRHPRPRLPAHHALTYDGKPLCTYHFDVVRVAELPADRLAQDPALAVLAPLARGATPEDFSRAVRCVRESWPTPDARELLTTMYIVGGKRFGAAVALQLIQLEEVMLSETYLQILNQGIERGIERGMEKGIERGIEAGLSRARHMLAIQVQLRFPAEPRLLDDLLPACTAEQLEALSALLITTPDARSLRQAALGVLGAPAK